MGKIVTNNTTSQIFIDFLSHSSFEEPKRIEVHVVVTCTILMHVYVHVHVHIVFYYIDTPLHV